MYFKPHDIDFAKAFIGVCSIVCLAATLFTFLTFLIDVKRFRYPERPIIFYAVCYSLVSLMYFIGFLLGNNAACVAASHPSAVETVVVGSQSKGCTLLFMLLYFFSIAGIVWWVILTITWFLAAGPKWSCEAIEKKAVGFVLFFPYFAAMRTVRAGTRSSFSSLVTSRGKRPNTHLSQ